MWKIGVETAKCNINKNLNTMQVTINETAKTETIILTLLRILESCGN